MSSKIASGAQDERQATVPLRGNPGPYITSWPGQETAWCWSGARGRALIRSHTHRALRSSG